MNVGIAGLGFMGSAIATRLIQTSHSVFVYNRNISKAETLAKAGATVSSSPKELADSCDLVIISVTDHNAVRDLLFGENGIVLSTKKTTVADSSTISPEQSRDCAKGLRENGVEMLGMPVMGGPPAALGGQLVPIVAGPKHAFEKARPVIEEIGKPVFYVGEIDGNANAIKLALNMNIALIAGAVSEGMTLVKALGIDPALFLEILNSTYFKTGLSERKGPKMAKGDFEPSFHLRNMLKDLELAAATARGAGVSLPLTSTAHQMYGAASSSGFSELDYTAIYGFLAKINGIE